MGAINRLPRGFLSFLGVKSLGVNPPFAQETVLPTLDHYRWINAGQLQQIKFGSGNIPNAAADFVPFSIISLRPPNGKMWICLGYCVRINTITAGDTVNFQAALLNAATIQAPYLVTPVLSATTSIALASISVLPMDPHQGLVVPQGAEFGVYLRSAAAIAAADAPMNGFAWVVELDD